MEVLEKPKIFFRPIGNSGPLSIYWFEGPYGDAVECSKGKGVAWLSPSGELLGVEFDDVKSKSDSQTLMISTGSEIKINVKNKRVKVYSKKSFVKY